MSAKYAPKRDDGLMAYVVLKRGWGRQYSRIEWAASLADAKHQYGWTREPHFSVSVRRATPEDLKAAR